MRYVVGFSLKTRADSIEGSSWEPRQIPFTFGLGVLFHIWVTDGKTHEFRLATNQDTFIIFLAGIVFTCPFPFAWGGTWVAWAVAFAASTAMHLVYNKWIAPYFGWPLARASNPFTKGQVLSDFLGEPVNLEMGETFSRKFLPLNNHSAA